MKLTLTIFLLFFCNVLIGCFLFQNPKLSYPDPANFTGVYYGDFMGEEKLILYPSDSTERNGRYVEFAKNKEGIRYRYEGKWEWEGSPYNEWSRGYEHGCSGARLYDKDYYDMKSTNSREVRNITICYRSGDSVLIDFRLDERIGLNHLTRYVRISSSISSDADKY